MDLSFESSFPKTRHGDVVKSNLKKLKRHWNIFFLHAKQLPDTAFDMQSRPKELRPFLSLN